MRIKLKTEKRIYGWWYIDWNLSKRRHKSHSPAFQNIENYKEWCLFGKWHNDTVPARIYSHGYKKFYVNGKLIKTEK